jgi:predicted Zn-dependent peptidase
MKNKEELLSNVFEYKLSNGMQVAVVEDSKINHVQFAAIVNAGLLESGDISLDGVKIDGLVALVMAKAFNYTALGKIGKILFEANALFEAEVTNSRTIFKVSTVKNAYELSTKLLNYFSNFEVTQNSLDCAKKEAIFDIEKRLQDEKFVNTLKVANIVFSNFSQIDILKLYKKKINAINITILRKFYAKYYSSGSMEFFIMGNVDKDLVKEALEKSSLVESKYKISEKEENHEEEISSKDKSFYQEDISREFSRVIISFKFPSRKKLYDKYENQLFSMYQYITHSIFSENSPTMRKAIKKGLITRINTFDLVEINEKTMLLGDFITFQPDKLIDFLQNSKTLIKAPSNQRFNKVKKQLIVAIKENCHNFESVLSLYLMANADNLKLLDLVNDVVKLSHKKFSDFVVDIKKCPRSIYVERGQK